MKEKGLRTLMLSVMGLGMVLVAAEAWAQCLLIDPFISPSPPVVVEKPDRCFTTEVLFTINAGLTGSCAGVVQDTVAFTFSGGGSGVEGKTIKPTQQTLGVGLEIPVQFTVRVTPDAKPDLRFFTITATSIISGSDSEVISVSVVEE